MKHWQCFLPNFHRQGRIPNSSKDEKTKIIIEDAINYLNDEDNPFGSEKICGYLNAKL